MIVSRDQPGIRQQRHIGVNAAVISGKRFGQSAN
jgi:hypothetical protein